MKNKALQEQIDQMAAALRGTDEEVQIHLLAKQAGFSWGEGWIMTEMRFAPTQENSPAEQHTGTRILHDSQIFIPEEGDATISCLDEDDPDISWVEEDLDPAQQMVLNEYTRRGRGILEVMRDDIIQDDEENEPTEEDLELDLAEDGTYQEKHAKFSELLRRTILMSQAATGDLKFIEQRILPENELVRKTLGTMETALHCLLAAATITGTELDPL